MNLTTHPVTLEGVMAFLDGELSVADAQAVSVHLDHCAECARAAAQFRKTSGDLKGWVIPKPAFSFETFVLRAAKTGSGSKIGKSNMFIRPRSWAWKHWAIASAMALAALVLVLGVSSPSLLRFPRLSTPRLVAYEGRLQTTERETSNGSLNKFQIAGQPISDQSKELDQLVTLATPGVAPDSNGLFHGLGSHAQTDQQSKPEPMIARTVSLVIVVKDFAASRSFLDRVLAQYRGYSGELNVSTPENAPRSLQASLRIPVAHLSSAVAALKTLGCVENESQSGEEVTQQHTDLAARLKTSRDTEQRFRTILQQRAGNVAEVLQVEEGIARVRGDIERMEAEQNALEHRVDFATVELQLTEEYKAQLNSPAGSVSTRIHNAFVAGVHNAFETVLGIVLLLAEYGPALLIWLAIFAAPLVLAWRRYKRKLATV